MNQVKALVSGSQVQRWLAWLTIFEKDELAETKADIRDLRKEFANWRRDTVASAPR